MNILIVYATKHGSSKKCAQMLLEKLVRSSIVNKSFGGEFKFKEMNFFEKLITKVVSKSLAKENTSAAMDITKDIYMLSEENINEFANMMNSAF